MSVDWIDWNLLTIYGFIVIGIIISVIIPILRTLLPKPTREALKEAIRGEKGTPTRWAIFSEAAMPYFYLAIFSVVTAVIVLAYLGSGASGITWGNAVIYGFTWDSILQKAVGIKDVVPLKSSTAS
jgi:uncharacterized membrane protein